MILPPHMDPLLEETSVIVKDKRYVSLLRTFRDALLSTQGIVEVKQYCDTLFGELDLLRGTSASIFVFDGEREPALSLRRDHRRLPTLPRARRAGRAPAHRDRRPPGEAGAADLRGRRLAGHGLDPPDRGAHRRPLGERPAVRGADRAPDPDRHRLLAGGVLLHRPPRDRADQGAARGDRGAGPGEPGRDRARGATGRTSARSTSCAWPSATCGGSSTSRSRRRCPCARTRRRPSWSRCSRSSTRTSSTTCCRPSASWRRRAPRPRSRT